MKGPEASWKGICSTYMRDQSRSPEKEDLAEKNVKRSQKTERTKKRPAQKRPRGPQRQQLASRRGWQKYFQPSSDAQANPSSKKLETQPLGKAPQPINKTLVWDKLKPETFGQNFRSKLSLKTFWDPSPIQFL